MRMLLLCLLALAAGRPLFAHHPGDPSSSPSSTSVLTPHLLAPGALELGYGWDYTAYKPLSKAELEAEVRALDHGHALTVRDSVSRQSLNLGYGILPWLQMDLSLATVRTENLREGHVHGDGSFGLHEFGSPSGLANTDLRFKARLAHGHGWSVAALAGLSLPTGQDNALDDGPVVDAVADTVTGEVAADASNAYLPPADQPGSGSTTGTLALSAGAEFGLWEADASLTGTLPAAVRGYKAGDTLALGLALRRLFGEPGHESQLVGLEFTAVQAGSSNVDGVAADDGGLSLAAGLRARLSLGGKARAVLGAALPLVQPTSQGPKAAASFSAAVQWGL